ncbi:DUF4132 domain-containing protein [Catenulispora pinisilvae]|uniref:DUF4132 domain-containing protein n=1 Tax=Catenulispora pinisilvae TaxID=2705253 RepID=UPI0018923C3C|nr:DUF4132 domain-containing protein [Catenulispora pinisilvae]
MRQKADDTEPPGGDESVLLWPSGWQRLVIPRRRERPGPAPAVAANAVAAYEKAKAADAAKVTEALTAPNADAALAAVYRAEAGRPLSDVTPTGAAVAATLRWASGSRKPAEARTTVDAWVTARGLEFAVLAVLERCDMAAQELKHTACALIRADPWLMWGGWQPRPAMLARLRHHLSAADDGEYAAVASLLSTHPFTGDGQRLAAAFLMPDQTAWVTAAINQMQVRPNNSPLTFGAVSTVEQADALFLTLPWGGSTDTETLATLMDGLGTDVLPYLLKYADVGYARSEVVERILTAVGAFPTDEALQALIDRVDRPKAAAAILAAAERYPRRGVRLLAASASERVQPLLRAHVLSHLDIAAAELEHLDGGARDRVKALLGDGPRIADAAADGVPAVLVTPPWTGQPRQAKPRPVTGLAVARESGMVWLPGERKLWNSDWGYQYHRSLNLTWEEIAESIKILKPQYGDLLEFFREGPEELVRPLFDAWNPGWWRGPDLDRAFAVRFEDDALPLLTARVREDPGMYGEVLIPFAHSDVATIMAGWLATPKPARPHAIAWLRRHPDLAARTLIPAAVGKSGTARRQAERALRTLVDEGFEANVSAAASAYGARVEAVVSAVLTEDLAPAIPKSMPTLPTWAESGQLPPILLTGGTSALPADAVRNLCLLLAIAKPGVPSPALDEVRSGCDPRSLTAFVWALFENWRNAEMPVSEAWALDALGRFGDDTIVPKLAALIRAWPGENAHHRAVQGLDVLGAIGTDAALGQLYAISQRVKFKALKERAAQRIHTVATTLGLTADQLGDRLVPGLGLDPSGTLRLSFGPRSFTVGFDEHLKPLVVAEDGKRLKDLPKPGAHDDAATAEQSRVRYAQLKKDARTLASDQAHRLERALLVGRRWSAAEFRTYVVDHPVVRDIARRLVWSAYCAEAAAPVCFRIAEDLTFADADDASFVLEDNVRVGVAHPLEFGDSAVKWSELFADYELVQPFQQLGRATWALTEQEKSALTLDRFTGKTVPTGKVVGLERFGWRRGDPRDHGLQTWMSRPVPGGGCVAFGIEPGVAMGSLSGLADEQTITAVWVTSLPDVELWQETKGRLPLGTLDAVSASELLRDLEVLTSG